MAAVCFLGDSSMKSIQEYFAKAGINLDNILTAAGVFLLGTLLLAMVGRFIFGKKNLLGQAVSSAIGVLFIYIVTVVLNSAGVRYEKLIAPLPFVTITPEVMFISSFVGGYEVVCAELLSMVILAFLMNLADRWLPRGKNIFSWTFFRVLTVAIGYGMHLIVVYLFRTYLPQGFVTYAPAIMLALLLIFLLTGITKILIGAILSATVNPFVGAMYTFFFANVIGKLVTRAVLTTAILAGLVYLLNHMGVIAIAIGQAALSAYIPFLLVLIGLWYFVNKVL